MIHEGTNITKFVQKDYYLPFRILVHIADVPGASDNETCVIEGLETIVR